MNTQNTGEKKPAQGGRSGDVAMNGQWSAYTPNFQDNGVVALDGLVLHPNGWVIEGKGSAQRFWLEIQQVGWLLFERVAELEFYAKASPDQGRWIATASHPGPCPDPDQAVSLSGVLWTRQAALEAHQSICAYQRGLSQMP